MRGSVVSRGAHGLCLLILCGIAGCAVEEEGPEALLTDQGSPVETSDSAAAVQAVDPRVTCVTLQRKPSSPGMVRDAHISQGAPAKNYGGSPIATLSADRCTPRNMLLWFDLRSIPSQASVTSATLVLHQRSTGASPVTAYRITASWAEALVTWSSFASAFAPTPVATASVGSDPKLSLDLKLLAQAWVAGRLRNQGVLLRQEDDGSTETVISPSETSSPRELPRLEVCYRTPTCETQNPCERAVLDTSQGRPVCVISNKPANTPCGDNQICNGEGVCKPSVHTQNVSCGRGTLSGNQLCQALGFAGASMANGYWWGQCAGTGDQCPGGWQGDGTTCGNWCGGTDCVGVPFCGPVPWSWGPVRERLGTGQTTFQADEFWSCNGWNPGWTVRVRCHY